MLTVGSAVEQNKSDRWQHVVRGSTCAGSLGQLLPPGKVAIVSGRRSFSQSRLYSILLGGLRHCEAKEFPGCRPDPQASDAAELGRALAVFAPGTIVAIGGGSVIDTAKVARMEYCPDSLLVAVPTTAGSGSEATPYASMTIMTKEGRKKISHNDRSLIPSVAILDPVAVEGLSREQRAISSMDALCQAFESYWSTRSVLQSDRFALRALRLMRRTLSAYLAGDTAAGATIQWAAYLSGRAIAITPTNSCHAVSYPLTVSCGIPHGWAAGITLPHLLRWNEPALDRKAAELCGVLEMSSVEQIARWIERLQQEAGLPARLGCWGVSAADLHFIVQNSYRPDRMYSNTRLISPDDLHWLLHHIL